MFIINSLVLFIIYVNLVSTDSTFCGNWTQIGEQKCIHIIDRENTVNHEKAIEMCAQTEKSHLITINSENEQKLIEKYLFKDNQILDNVWIGLKNENGFKWSDKSSVDYTNWADKSPINETNLNCVQIPTEAILKGKWVNENCNKKAVVVCEKTVDIKKIMEEMRKLIKENEELKKLQNCENQLSMNVNELTSRIKQFHSHYNISKPFIDFDNKQKVLFTVWNNTYDYILRKDPSFRLCESLNSNILEIRSKQKQEIVNKQLEEWFKGITNGLWFWLNGMRDSSGKWRWNTDGMEFNYTNWDVGHPVNHREILELFYDSKLNSSLWESTTILEYYIICEHSLK